MGAKSKITDLRDHLFDTLTALRDKDKPMEIDRARAIAEVAKVIVDTAKVEVDFLKVRNDARSTEFLLEEHEETTPARAQLELRARR